MRTVLACIFLIMLSQGTSAQSFYTDSMWCAAWAPQTWSQTDGYKACRGGKSSTLVKTLPAAKVYGPFYRSPGMLRAECMGKSDLGCASRLRPGRCYIYLSTALIGTALHARVLAEERAHCQGYTHR